jgi:uncharacterized protein (DUF362 family)
MRRAPPKVIIRHCAGYDPGRVRGIVREGLEELGLRPVGRTLVKPNLVIADDRFFPHAYTRPEFADGVLGALRDRDDGSMTELAVGEHCGITLPGRFAFRNAHYHPVLRRHRARRYLFDEVRQVEIELRHPDRLRDCLFAPEPVARADFFVSCPKFKAHPWTTVTFALKNHVGLQDDRHRLIDHDHRLDEKIADLQEIIHPGFIAIDAIAAGQERMLTPVPFELKLILMGTNPVAFDAVCCRVIGLDASTVDHIRLAAARGYGPLDLGAVEITGDVTLDEARERARGFRVGRKRVERFFAGSRIRAHAGPPPEPERTDYCWGGCPGAAEEAIEIVRQVDGEADVAMRPLTLVFGAYDGPIDAGEEEKVVFIGDCARWRGRLRGEAVDLPSRYTDRRLRDPHRAKVSGLYRKMLSVFWRLFRTRRQSFVRLPGCPVSTAEQVLVLARLGGVRNPYFHPRTVLKFNLAYLGWRLANWRRRLGGRGDRGPALRQGERGAAAHGPPPRSSLPDRGATPGGPEAG